MPFHIPHVILNYGLSFQHQVAKTEFVWYGNHKERTRVEVTQCMGSLGLDKLLNQSCDSQGKMWDKRKISTGQQSFSMFLWKCVTKQIDSKDHDGERAWMISELNII